MDSHTPYWDPVALPPGTELRLNACKKKKKNKQGQGKVSSVTEDTSKGCVLLKGVPTLEDSSLGVLLPGGSLVPGPRPSFFCRELAGARPPPPDCLSPFQPLFPYLQKRIIFSTPGIFEGVELSCSGEAGAQGSHLGERRGGSGRPRAAAFTGGPGVACPLGLVSIPLLDPPDGVRVPLPLLQVRELNPPCWTLCAQRSCPARLSHGNLAVVQPLTPAPPGMALPPLGPPCCPPHRRSGSYGKGDAPRKLTPPRLPHQMAQVSAPLSFHGHEHLRGPRGGHSWGPLRCVAAPWRGTLVPCGREHARRSGTAPSLCQWPPSLSARG